MEGPSPSSRLEWLRTCVNLSHPLPLSDPMLHTVTLCLETCPNSPSLRDEQQCLSLRLLRSFAALLPSHGTYWSADRPLLWARALAALLAVCRDARNDRQRRRDALEAGRDVMHALYGGERRVAGAVVPGYASALVALCCGDYKQGVALTECAVKELAWLASALFPMAQVHGEDDQDAALQLRSLLGLDPPVPAGAAAPKNDPSPPTAATNLSVDVEDPQWKQDTLAKITEMWKKVLAYVQHTYSATLHDEPTVRLRLAEACGFLLGRCTRDFISPLVKGLADVLALSAADPWESVREVARAQLSQLGATRSLLLQSSVKDSFVALVVALPRILRTTTMLDSEKVDTLRLAAAYARFMDEAQLGALLGSSTTLVAESLVQAFSLDRGAAQVVDQGDSLFVRAMHISLGHLEDQKGSKSLSSSSSSFRAPLLFCQRSDLSDALFDVVVQLVVRSPSSSLALLDFFLDALMVPNHERMAESALICKHMFIGYVSSSNTTVSSLALRILEVMTHVVVTTDTLALAFCCETIMVIVSKLRDTFAPRVADTVPFLLKCLGNSDTRLSFAAFSALNALATWTCHCSVDDLIRDNADYIVDVIVKDLRAAQRASLMSGNSSTNVPQTVDGILKHSPTNVSWLLDDVLTEVLASLDASPKGRADLLVHTRILSDISSALVSQRPEQGELEADRNKEGDDNEDNNDDDDDDDARNPDVDDEPHVTRRQSIALRILDRVHNFLSFGDLTVQIYCINAVWNCLRVLASNRRKLLPAIYSVWDPLLLRLEAVFGSESSSDTILAMIRVLDVVGVIAELGTDFLFGEKFERLWRAFAPLLHPGKGGDGPAALVEKLRLSMLKCMLQFVQYVPISPVNGRAIIDTLLSLKQEPALCAQILRHLACRSNSHRVYLWFIASKSPHLHDLATYALGIPESAE